MQTMGRAGTIAMVIGLTVVLGVVVGFSAGRPGIPPVILWVILFPAVVRLWTSLLGGRRAKAGEPANAAGTETVLLDVSDSGRRWIQTIVPIVGTILGALGVAMWFRADGGPGVVAVSATVIGIVLVVVSLRTIITWEVSYKGHAIRFQNDPCLAERLFVDDQLVARGGVGVHMVLSGTIATGDGAGTTITARSRAGLFSFSCRIVAVPAASVAQS
jgi:hypothetical protein